MTTVFDGGVCIFGPRQPAQLSALRETAEFLSEYLGTMLFAFFGSLAGGGGVGAAGGNGLALAVLVYITASVSGGKLNPGVSLALFLISPRRALLGGGLLEACSARDRAGRGWCAAQSC